MYDKQNKQERIRTAREWLSRHSEILEDQKDLVRLYKYEPKRWHKHAVEDLEEMKIRMDDHLQVIEKRVEKYKTLPRTLTAQFEVAKKRKAAAKGEITKTQNKILRKLDK